MTSRLARPVAVAGVISGYLLLLFGGGLWNGIYDTDMRVALVLAGGGGAVVWLLAALVRPELRPRSRLTAAFAASLVAFAVSGLLAWQQRLGLDYLAYAVLLTALYLLLVRLWSWPFGARPLLAATVAATIGTAALYLATIVGLWITFWSQLGRFAIPPLRPGYEGLWLGNPNALASLLILLFVTSAAGVGLGSRRSRALVGGMAVMVAMCVLLTGSRGSWLGLAAAVVVVGVVALASGPRRRAIADVLKGGRARVVVVVTAIGVVVVGAVFAPAVMTRLGEQAAETRTSFWAASLRMIQQHPLVGLGPGSWAPARVSWTVAPDADYYIPHAHNVPLQVAAEFGVVGVIAAIIVIGLLIALVRDGIRSGDAPTRAAAWATLFGVTYLAGQSMVDAYIHQPAILLALALPIARLDALVLDVLPSGVAPGRSPRALTAVLLAAVVVCTAVAFAVEPAAKWQERAVEAADDGDWASALASARAAAIAEPGLEPVQLTYGLALAQTGDLAGAQDAFAKAAALDDLPTAWLDLAATASRNGDDAVALDAVAKALRLGSQQPRLAVPGAELAMALGDSTLARDALATAFATAPSLARDARWREPAWAAVASDALGDAQARLPDGYAALMLALERDDTQLAAAIAARLPAPFGPDAIVAAKAWAGDQAAFDDLVERSIARPLDVQLLSLCRRTADVARAERGADWSCDDAGWTAFYPVVYLGPPTEGEVMPGPDPYPNAMFAYRRDGPLRLVVPWATQVTSRIP